VNTGNLSLLLGSRPRKRALAQIFCRRTIWPLNDHVVGRGASRPPLGRHFTASTRNAKHNYVPWTTPGLLPVHLSGRPGPHAVRSVVEKKAAPASARTSGEKPATAPAHPVRPAGQEPENDLGSIRSEQKPENDLGRNRSEQEPVNDLSRIRSKLSLWDADERQAQALPNPNASLLPLHQSDTIHVLGLNPSGLYIAHTLAGCGTIPPVRFILDKYYQYRQWSQNHQCLTLYRGDERIVRHGVVAEPAFGYQAKASMIHNLIVTVSAGRVVDTIGLIKHRLNHNSTICLVNDGLGVAEALIDAYFPDVLSRPVFILGHFTAAVGHTGNSFAVSEVRRGRLYLSLFSQQGERNFRIKFHPPLERIDRATRLIRLLTAIPQLRASGHPMPDLLAYKLPRVAFRTIMEPLAALFDCRYDYLPKDRHARILMDQLVGELSSVVSRFPECRDSAKLRQFTITESLRREAFRKLMQQRTADSPMRAQVGRGWEIDLEFLSGYFARRGREVHARVAALEAVMRAVRAKQNVLLKRLAEEIPFEGSGMAQGVGVAVPIDPSETVEAVEEAIDPYGVFEELRQVEPSNDSLGGTRF